MVNANNDPKDIAGAILVAALGITYNTNDAWVDLARKAAIALGVPEHKVNYAELGTILELIKEQNPVIS
jgi:hypothetical protein